MINREVLPYEEAQRRLEGSIKELLSTIQMKKEFQTNVSEEDMRKYHKRTFRYASDYVLHELFFESSPNSIYFVTHMYSNFQVNLKRKDYGFSLDERAKLSPVNPLIQVCPRHVATLDKILSSNDLPLNELLESVGSMINDSMIYDLTKSKEKIDPSLLEKIQKIMQSREYRPNGDEVMMGGCVESGQLIRKVLHHLNIENIRYNHLSTSIDGIAHDTTTAYNILSGRWAVINSKSPRIGFNLVPLEAVNQMGSRYNP